MSEMLFSRISGRSDEDCHREKSKSRYFLLWSQVGVTWGVWCMRMHCGRRAGSKKAKQ
jgi:hypothetical protein